MKHKLLTSLLLALIILFHYTAKTNLAGAPAGHSGAPGEGNCTSCHAGQPISQAPNLMASFSQYNLPVQTLFRGQTYQVKVRLNGLNHNYGFQFSAKNPATGLPVGFFNTFSGTSPIGSSIQQNQFGTTSNTPQGREWSFEFVTPSTYTGDSIVFYVAGMLGNQDGQVTGDQVLLQSYRFAVSSGTPPTPPPPPTPPSISWNSSPNQLCPNTLSQCTFTATGTFDTTRWLYLELFNSIIGIITLDSIQARPTNQGQFNFSTTGLTHGNYQMRITERQTGFSSSTRALTIIRLEDPIIVSTFDSTPTAHIQNWNSNQYTYSWTKDGNPIANSANLSLINLDSYGVYRALAKNNLCPNNWIGQSNPSNYIPLQNFQWFNTCIPSWGPTSLPINQMYFPPTSRFILQLSDSTGEFTDSSYQLVNEITATAPIICCFIGLPGNLSTNGTYRMRALVTNPTFYGQPTNYFSVRKKPNAPVIVNNNGILSVVNPIHQIRWSREGRTIPFANSSSFTPLISGVYMAEYYDGFCFSKYSNEIYVIVTSTQEVSLPIRLSPNPAHQEVILESDQDLDYSQITLLDINGRMLQPVFHQVTPNRIRIETSALPNGLYVLQHQNQRAKLVVQH